MAWPADPQRLESLQAELASLDPSPWRPTGSWTVGGCFVCFGRGGSGPGAAEDHGWAAATVMAGRRLLGSAVVEGEAGSAYGAGLLSAREGPLLDAAVRALSSPPDVLLVNATGRDHPRRAGLAVHLGWMLDLPTVGVTHRPLVAEGGTPGPWQGSHTPLMIGGEQVGWWLRTQPGARAVAVSPGWGTQLDTCLPVVTEAVVRVRTPEPIRQARRLARTARSPA